MVALKEEHGWLAGAVATAWVLVVVFAMVGMDRAAADHLTGCRQYDSGDEGAYYAGHSGCDEFWMRGGNDQIDGRGDFDEAHMGSGADIAHGDEGPDTLVGGENGNVYADALYGDAGADDLTDATGADKDWQCGGGGVDNLYIFDNDTLDTGTGEGNPTCCPDIIQGDVAGSPTDQIYPDNTCVDSRG